MPDELFQKRTSRKNRVLISWKTVKNNNLTVEQLETLLGYYDVKGSRITLKGYQQIAVDNVDEDAEEEALYCCSCDELGAEILNMSNPGDYEYDEDTYEDPEFEIIEVDD